MPIAKKNEKFAKNSEFFEIIPEMVALSEADSQKWDSLLLRNNYSTKPAKNELGDAGWQVARGVRRKQRMLSPEEKLEAIRVFNGGLQVKEVSEKYNCHKSTILRLLKDNGISTARKSIILRGKEADVAELYKSGLSMDEIAKKFGVSTPSVQLCLDLQGIARRNKHKHKNSIADNNS